MFKKSPSPRSNGPRRKQTARKHLGNGRQSGVPKSLYQIGGPPSIQLALKLQF